MIVNCGPYHVTDATETSTDPLVIPCGTVTAICVSLQLCTAAGVPKKSTVLLACVAPKPVPVIVMGSPAWPMFAEMPGMESGSSSENCTPLLVIASSVSVTGPFVAVEGPTTETLVSLHVLTVATTPLN